MGSLLSVMAVTVTANVPAGHDGVVVKATGRVLVMQLGIIASLLKILWHCHDITPAAITDLTATGKRRRTALGGLIHQDEQA